MGPHPCMWISQPDHYQAQERERAENYCSGALAYVTVFNEPHMPVILVLSLPGSHGTVRAQYTKCSLTQNHKTALKILQLLYLLCYLFTGGSHGRLNMHSSEKKKIH